MALPRLDSIKSPDEWLAEKASYAIDDIFDRFSGTVSSITDRIADTIADAFKPIQEMDEEKGVSLVDQIKSYFSTNYIDRFNRFFESNPSTPQNDDLQKLVEQLREDTNDNFRSLEDSVNAINNTLVGNHEEDAWKQEKRDAIDDVMPEPEPIEPDTDPAVDPKNMTVLLTGFFTKLVKNILTKLPYALIGTAVAGGIFDSIVNWDYAEQISKTLGANKGVGGILYSAFGDPHSRLGIFGAAARWAGPGALAGFVLSGPAGFIAGGLVGAAIGIALNSIQEFVGYEKLEQGLDKTVDKFNSMVEVFTGVDTNRLESRIADMKRGRDSTQKRLDQTVKSIADLSKRINEAAERGDAAQVRSLNIKLKSLEDLEKYQKDLIDNFSSRERSFMKEIQEKDKAWYERGFEMLNDLWNEITSIPLRLFETALAPFNSNSMLETAFGDRETLYRNSVTASAGEYVGKFFRDFSDWLIGFVSSVETETVKKFTEYRDFGSRLVAQIQERVSECYDSLASFFTDTVPDLIGKVIDSIKKRFTDIFNSIVDTVKAFADEISYKDFLPEILGGNKETIQERVSKRLSENINHSSAQAENVIQNVTNSTTENHSNSTNNYTAVQQNNVRNTKNVVLPNSVRNQDAGAQILSYGASGLIVAP